jgi:hypothetical protein
MISPFFLIGRNPLLDRWRGPLPDALAKYIHERKQSAGRGQDGCVDGEAAQEAPFLDPGRSAEGHGKPDDTAEAGYVNKNGTTEYNKQ